MTVVHDLPPRWGQFVETFSLTREECLRRGIAFTFGKIVFFLPEKPLSPELEAHERVHMQQQGDDVDGWWDRYFADPAFRAAQELEAHKVGIATYARRVPDRNFIARFAASIAQDLAGQLYGRVMPYGVAYAALMQAAKGRR